ncbi:uncharacterized protein N7498_005735 [Penicillium cinerascens]|uniref:Uncharacterized protein n=1 Tax=Penicillium cinerascens TaxID=70096 RepID=A0A9W9MP18_9EURO|nr:uncharacterized protein N7498_005735 [Penicillium cinerascens]KAJ5204856.1 hypothetical protein N7498_005735 [Penicillium cinerascens]
MPDQTKPHRPAASDVLGLHQILLVLMLFDPVNTGLEYGQLVLVFDKTPGQFFYASPSFLDAALIELGDIAVVVNRGSAGSGLPRALNGRRGALQAGGGRRDQVGGGRDIREAPLESSNLFLQLLPLLCMPLFLQLLLRGPPLLLHLALEFGAPSLGQARQNTAQFPQDPGLLAPRDNKPTSAGLRDTSLDDVPIC